MDIILRERYIIIIFLLILKAYMASFSEICNSCEDCSDYSVSSSICFCERMADFKITESHYYGRYSQHKEKISEYIICRNVQNSSILGTNICPDNDCKNITLQQSSITTIQSNFFMNLRSVDKIVVKDSQVEHIQAGAFSGLTKIEILNLDENRLSRILRGCFNSLLQLKELDLRNNQITSIEDESFHGLQSLESLYLNNNKLQNFSANLLSSLTKLETLNLAGNLLTTVNFNMKNLINLKNLHLNSNQIQYITECLSARLLFWKGSCFPTSLETLDLEKNNIGLMNIDTFENLLQLRSLDLSENKINDIPLQLFQDLNSLKVLDLSKNNISDLSNGIFSGLQALTDLNLGSLKLKKLETRAFAPLKHLTTLNIKSNNLQRIDSDILDFCPDLKSFNIDGNKFSCSVVASLILKSKQKGVSMLHTRNLTVENIDGIPCHEMRDDSEYLSFEQNVVSTLELQLKNLSEIVGNLSLDNEAQDKSDETRFSQILKAIKQLEYRTLTSDNRSYDNELSESEKEYFESFFSKLIDAISTSSNYTKPEILQTIDGVTEKTNNIDIGISKATLSNENMRNLLETVINKLQLLISLFVVTFLILFLAVFIIFGRQSFRKFFGNNNKSITLSHEMPILES